jgi:hypothetical protein
MADLGKILEERRPAIEAGLEAALQELAEIEERRRELEGLVARARAALGARVQASGTGGRTTLKLHEAMKLILSEAPGRAMTVQELAHEINERGLYEKRDGSPIEPNQIHARAGATAYAHMFRKERGVVTLRQGAGSAP